MRISTFFLGGGLALAVAAACGPGPEPATGVFANLGDPIPSATPDELATFNRGKAVALHRFTKAEGLGPDFNVTFCAACHERPTTGGGGGRYRNFLLVGQTLADQSFNPLGKSGVLDQYDLAAGRVATPSQTNVMATRNPIPFFGVGLIAELPDSVILANADPNDANHDGIRGRANYDRGFVGRFGLKSQTVSVEGFIRGPLFNHAGITTNPLSDAMRAKLPVPPEDSGVSSTKSFFQAAAPDAPTTDDDGVPDPEMSEQSLFDLVSYAMLLAAPKPDDPTPDSEAGRALFQKLNCTGCHVPSLAGPRGLVPLYSDLLLHDMGPALADGIVMKLAGGSDFRTQPLWGVAAEGPYLHDGRADTLDEAIRMHGGEAQAARDAYVALAPSDQNLVQTFLESLGGRSQTSTGLVPPGAPILDVGDYGGPATALAGDDAARFTAGRAVFDRDVPLAGGLGPEFNGDSCRACHFDPVIGGSGPADVNVIRQAYVTPAGFVPQADGTMLHHQSAAIGVRPEPEPMCDYFEPRQPPAVFGLGLVDRIADATIVSHEDPYDADGDGIRGRASRLADGRIGRFGWKADVPSLAEFARDALSNEIGLTVPVQSGLTFGKTSDADGAADPEIAQTDIDALVFFMSSLAPPPRTHQNISLEQTGEALFTSVGCAKCHIPSMQTSDGATVQLYSDLLLHDLGPAYGPGIVDGQAGMTDFRTAPLWGLAKTAPYMHDGRAFTIDDAVLAHGGEAQAIRDAFTQLSPADHDALVAFLGSL
ncbi:MAG TPA: di-heme oxidoredictase family protein [Polyangiaceae bacterium]|jgi:CxxC motif-containing protein (DUF1111 family)